MSDRNLVVEFLTLTEHQTNYMAGWLLSYVKRTEPEVVAEAIDRAREEWPNDH